MNTVFICLGLACVVGLYAFLRAISTPGATKGPAFANTEPLAFPGTGDYRTKREIDAYIKAENANPEHMAALYADNLIERGTPSYIAIAQGAHKYGADDQKVRVLLNLM